MNVKGPVVAPEFFQAESGQGVAQCLRVLEHGDPPTERCQQARHGRTCRLLVKAVTALIDVFSREPDPGHRFAHVWRGDPLQRPEPVLMETDQGLVTGGHERQLRGQRPAVNGLRITPEQLSMTLAACRTMKFVARLWLREAKTRCDGGK